MNPLIEDLYPDLIIGYYFDRVQFMYWRKKINFYDYEIFYQDTLGM